jgi:hypothetical protein
VCVVLFLWKQLYTFLLWINSNDLLVESWIFYFLDPCWILPPFLFISLACILGYKILNIWPKFNFRIFLIVEYNFSIIGFIFESPFVLYWSYSYELTRYISSLVTVFGNAPSKTTPYISKQREYMLGFYIQLLLTLTML